MKKILDLYSGLGGWSEAFARSGNWEIMRIENNPLLSEVPNTQVYDVLKFRDELKQMILDGYAPESPELIVASPPCVEFSNGWSSPKSTYRRENGTLEGYEPNMELMQAVIDIVAMLQPRYWLIENVVGATRYFNPILGEPTQIIGHYVLWGNFPHIIYDANTLPMKKDKDKRHHPLRANIMAQIPLCLSNALLNSVECQTSLLDWI
jgi:hypothetical protein|tara:strand:+ start:500 stop:1120 length:621 start_codon:yes stop_codon:yes gene_type:complete